LACGLSCSTVMKYYGGWAATRSLCEER
jgi:hypothetical protein